MEFRIRAESIADGLRKDRDGSSEQTPGHAIPKEHISTSLSLEAFVLGTSVDEKALIEFIGTPNKVIIATRYQNGIKEVVSVTVNNIKAVPGETIAKFPDGQFAVIKNS